WWVTRRQLSPPPREEAGARSAPGGGFDEPPAGKGAETNANRCRAALVVAPETIRVAAHAFPPANRDRALHRRLCLSRRTSHRTRWRTAREGRAGYARFESHCVP